jgi:DNA topoisomerase-1
MDDFDVDSEEDVPMAQLKRKKNPTKVTEDKKKKRKSVVPDVVPSKSKSSAKKAKAKRPAVHDDDEDEDMDRKPPVKKKVKVEETTSSATPTKKLQQKELKRLDRAERLQYAMQAFLWWDAPEPPPGCQWVTMEHNGVSFPETYVPHGVKLLYDGKPVDLTPIEEEA